MQCKYYDKHVFFLWGYIEDNIYNKNTYIKDSYRYIHINKKKNKIKYIAVRKNMIK